MLILFLLLFFVAPLYAQSDQIILPDVDLVIEDQSIIKTDTEEIAELRERNPQFQDVYLNELFSGIADVSFAEAISQRPNNRFSQFSLQYGSFNNTEISVYSQNIITNLLYLFSYQGSFQDNYEWNNQEFRNTGFMHNELDLNFSYAINNIIADFSLSYYFLRNDFFVRDFLRYDMHYIPFSSQVKYWLDEKSYFKFDFNLNANLFSQKNIANINQNEKTLIDGDLAFSYHVNPKDWNYTTIELQYIGDSYNMNTLHNQFRFLILSEFLLGRGWGLDAGAVLGSFDTSFIAWPEVRLYYQYFGSFMIDMKVSGDFTVLDSALLAQQKQFDSFSAHPEYYYEYSSTSSVKPNNFVSLGVSFVYRDYRSRRVYQYDDAQQSYIFTQFNNMGVFGFSTFLKADDSKIVDFSFVYNYLDLPNDFLLEHNHQFETILGLGYRPVGFRFEISYQLLGSSNLGLKTVPIFHNLGIRVSQKILKVAEIYLSVENLLNQNSQLYIGNYTGGLQASGGLTLKF